MSLVFENICHDYGDTAILKDVSLAAQSGEILCLLGPSGCGKTTLLNIAAGILELQSGTITLDENELASPQNCPPPEKRAVGLVLQDGALFPHMTVEDNIEFGILKRSDRRDISSKLLEQVGLSGLKKRFPHSLSGGQQQRVAVARSLAPEPRVILMDEPFANIDIVLRRRLREEIRQVLKSQNCITIMVTHDPEEAMEISDKVAVMLGGRIAQIGRPKEIYQNPISPEVAKLTSEGVIIPAILNGAALKTEFGDWPTDSISNRSIITENEKLNLFIRPFTVDMKTDSAEGSSLQVKEIRHIGPAQIITVSSSSGSFLSLQVAAESDFKVGQEVSLHPKKASLLAFPD
jgi:iron(III) transport system ATP-binding protein